MYFIVSMRASSSTAAAPQHGQRQPHQMHFGHGIVEVEHRETHWGARMWGAQTTKEIMGNGTSSKGTSSNVSRQGHCGQRQRRHRSKGSGGNRWVGVRQAQGQHSRTRLPDGQRKGGWESQFKDIELQLGQVAK